MFRRKEEGLFDSDVLERTDEIESINIVSPAASASSGFTAASAQTPAPQRPNLSVPPFVTSNTATAPQAAPQRPAQQQASAVPSSATQPITDTSRARSAADIKPSVPLASSTPSLNKSGTRVLTVGNDILLKGEIATCDRLVIQGKVEATLNDVHTVELAEIGTFKGVANVVDAHISGTFEGDLVCTGKLIIFASGKVRGKITYGEIEIERGGELTGEIKTVSSAKNAGSNIRKEAA